MRVSLLGAVLLGAAALPALASAQNYPPPPPGYMAQPPHDWNNQDFWRHRPDAERRRFWADYRRHSWRCDHGDHYACHWLHEHARG